MMDLRRLVHVLAVHKTRSFSRAAQSLGLTQPALSKSVASLEAEVGFIIFERSRSEVLPTAAGRFLVEEASRLVGDAQEFNRAMHRVGKGEEGQVRFGLGPLAAVAVLPALLEIVVKERPGINVQVAVDGGPEIVRRTLADELEFCCTADVMVPKHERGTTLPVARLPLTLIARANHPLTLGCGTITDYPLVGGSTSDDSAYAYRPRVQCDDNSLLKKLVLNSDSIWLTAPAAAREELSAGSLIILPNKYDYSDQEIRIVIFRHRGRTLSPAAHFVEQTLRRLILTLSNMP